MDNAFSSSLFVQSLVAPDTRDLAGEWVSKRQRGKGSRWVLDTSLSPADLYIYLKARFGPPNGVMMILRAPHSDNFIQWHYTLKSGISDFEILGLNTRTEFMISEYDNLGENDWSALVAEIKRDFKRYGPKLKEVRKHLEHWRLFYNPYYRLKEIVRRCSGELAEIIGQSFELPVDPPAFPKIYTSAQEGLAEDFSEFSTKIQAIADRYRRVQEVSTSLRLICPVWAEAFVNFIIFALCREEIKKDRRIYRDFITKDIDVRIKLLHINCVGFKKPIDTSHQKFKSFHSLMNERNDLLHGNIDPNKLGYETVYFDGTIPLFTEPQGLARNSLGVSLVGIEPDETLKRVDIVHSFVDFTLGHLERPYEESLTLILDRRDLGWRAETNRIGVLFSDSIAEGFGR